MTDSRARIKDWFANAFNREQFKLSMGETKVESAGVRVLISFLAQGVADLAYADDRYLDQLIESHKKIAAMIEDLRKVPGYDQSCVYHHPLVLGVIIETAIQAVAQLKKEDRES